eukprot:gb/GFBE01050301.1/.p1 GENE.gb/GFBE01050301.1/~~gb/GFBE01050301.1/.p1  ORF type:complete len:152 (+),score=19.74 gb/GFBE01050301.1/:1-456(+)
MSSSRHGSSIVSAAARGMAVLKGCCAAAAKCCGRTASCVKACSPWETLSKSDLGDYPQNPVEGKAEAPVQSNLPTLLRSKRSAKKSRREGGQPQFNLVNPGPNGQRAEAEVHKNLAGRIGSLNVGDAFGDLLRWAEQSSSEDEIWAENVLV